MRFAYTGALSGLCLLLSACGATTSATPATPAPVTSAPATSAPATSVRAAQPAASTSTTAAPSSSATKLTLDPSGTRASYHAHEQLVGRNLPSDAVGTSSSVSGSIVLNSDGSVDSGQSEIKVDLSKLSSDESRRDSFIKSSTLQTSRFPMATFVPRSADGLPSPLPDNGLSTFQLQGDLTVHGVTQPVTWQVTAQFAAGSVSGSATTDVNISDFGMTPPKAGPVLSIQDGLTLELAFTASREA
jgi:polyisoprenoid-binding protein YceI